MKSNFLFGAENIQYIIELLSFFLFLLPISRHTYSSARNTTRQSHKRLTLKQHLNNPGRKSTPGWKRKLRVSWAWPQHLPSANKSAWRSLWAGALEWAASRDAVGGQSKSSTGTARNTWCRPQWGLWETSSKAGGDGCLPGGTFLRCPKV